MSDFKPHIYLKLYRICSRKNSTLGMLYVERPSKFNIGERAKEYLCFTLEDEARENKIPGETRIPAGKYEIKLRTEGGHDARYSTRFRGMHKGMLELQDVPEFKYILIHCGNTEEDTAGCLLLGYDASRLAGGEHAIYKSLLQCVSHSSRCLSCRR